MSASRAVHADLADTIARLRLAHRLDRAVAGLSDPAAPLAVVDLDAFDDNASDLVARAGGTPIRVASKSLRVPDLLRQALAGRGFSGVLCYTLREALWLCEQGISDDLLMGYPTVDAVALGRMLGDDAARARITLMIDAAEHLEAVAAAGDPQGVRVAVDIDAGLLVAGRHVGPKRSPLRDDQAVVELAERAIGLGFSVVGVMTYEGQVAGVADDVPGQRARSYVVRRLKAASMSQLAERRTRARRALERVTELELWNAGGSGSIEASAADPAVTEVSAGSGLLVPGLFDHYRSFSPRPAAFYGLRVVRRPGPGTVTVAGGGFVASGPAGPDRLPLPWAPPGLHLTGLEAAGEVQTPLTGPAADSSQIGDLVWFRHAKSGELAEHTNVVHLVRGDTIVDTVPTYRGLGLAW